MLGEERALFKARYPIFSRHFSDDDDLERPRNAVPVSIPRRQLETLFPGTFGTVEFD